MCGLISLPCSRGEAAQRSARQCPWSCVRAIEGMARGCEATRRGRAPPHRARQAACPPFAPHRARAASCGRSSRGSCPQRTPFDRGRDGLADRGSTQVMDGLTKTRTRQLAQGFAGGTTSLANAPCEAIDKAASSSQHDGDGGPVRSDRNSDLSVSTFDVLHSTQARRARYENTLAHAGSGQKAIPCVASGLNAGCQTRTT